MKKIFLLVISFSMAFNFCFAQSKNNEFDLFLQKITKYYGLKEYDALLVFTDNLIKTSKDKDVLYYSFFYRGLVYYNLKKDVLAEKSLLKVILFSRYDDIFDKSCKMLFDILLEKNDFGTFNEVFEKYFKHHKEDKIETTSELYYYKARLDYQKKNFPKALKHFNSSLKFVKSEQLKDSIYKYIGFCLLEQQKNKKALEMFDKIKNHKIKLLAKGRYYFKQQNYRAALDIYNSFLNNYSDDRQVFRIMLQKAESFYLLGRMKDALGLYQQNAIRFSNLGNVRIVNENFYGLAWVYLKMGKFTQAIENFKKISDTTGDDYLKLNSILRIADCYYYNKDYEKALREYNYVIDTFPSNVYLDYIEFQKAVILLELKKYQDAYTGFLLFKEKYEKSKLLKRIDFYLGVASFSMENYDKSLYYLKRFIEGNPDNLLITKAYYMLGKTFMNMQNYQKALESFEKVAGKFDDRYNEEVILLDIGFSHFYLQDYRKACDIFLDFLKKFPRSKYLPDVFLAVGKCYQYLQDYKKTKDYYKHVSENYSDTSAASEALILLSEFFWINSNPKLVREKLTDLIEQDNEFKIRAQFVLAQSYAVEKDIDKACLIYDDISKDKKYFHEAVLKKAKLLKGQKRYSEAAKSFKRIIKYGHDSSKTRLDLGFCLEKTGEVSSAQEQYKTVIYTFNNIDDKIKAYLRLARIYEKQNNLDEAKNAYNQIIKTNQPEAKIAKERLKKITVN